MLTEIQLLETVDLNISDFCLSGWMKSEVYKGKVDALGELPARILDAAARINPLKTKRRLLYLKTQFVPHSKHFSTRL